jgi:type IV secretory pathway TrbF-like protein
MSIETPDVVAKPLTTRGYLGELYAGALTWNTYFKRAGLVLLVIIAGQQVQIYRLNERLATVKPVFVRIDELGRHDLVSYDEATESKPRAHELRTALRTFVVKHFSLMRSVVTRDFKESLYFLKPTLQDVAMRDTRKQVDAFNASLAADEIDINVLNVKLTDIDTPPYKAEVVFDKVFYQTGTRIVRKPNETFTLHLSFELQDASATEYLEINPLGLRITAMRLEQAFRQPQQALK